MEATKSQSVEELDSWPTLIVVEFSTKADQVTVEWIQAKIQSAVSRGGADLLVKPVEVEDQKQCILHIGAKTERLLEAAELMEIQKEYNDGSMRDFSLADLDHFKNSEDLDDFLSQSEKQRIILHELQTIRALESDDHVPGCPDMKLYHGECIVPKLKKEDIIEMIFPLHDKEVLKRLGFSWYKTFWTSQPLDEIRKYFGETIAMYFAFLGFYTMALIPPAFIGLVSALLGNKNVNLQLFFAVFNMVWVTVFLEAWKRRCSVLSYKWGTIRTEVYEEARPEYYGRLATNKITDRLEPRYPKWKRMARFYGVSIPIVLVCLAIAFYIMLIYFRAEEWVIANNKLKQSTFSYLLLFGPTIVYSVIIYVLNAMYRKLAKLLNDWENHRLQSAYNNHLITKLVCFDFMNCFMCLFYTAFVWRDMQVLKNSMAVLLVTTQIINQVLETVVPFYLFKFRAKQIKKRSPENTDKTLELDMIEATRDEYEGPLDDYLEMFLQFGYVFLFSSVYPYAAFFALINNITEIRTDAFKICRINQRPFSQPASNIGAWQTAFEAMGVIAVMTNCALIGLSPPVQKYLPDYGAFNIFFYFVVAEHLILLAKFALAYLIPDEPGWVHVALARADYQAKQAWRKDRSGKAKDAFSKRTSKLNLEKKD